MQEHWSIEKYQKYLQGKGKKVFDGGNRSKYGAIKTSIDGHTFDSKKEAEYYCELKLRLQCGDIKGFCLQPIFILAEGLKYKADFVVFNNDNTTEIIDVKGFKTKEYITKKKVFEDKYNLKIKEILAAFWLTHTNDEFYNYFGFNWVPPIEIQEEARKVINMTQNKNAKEILNIPLLKRADMESIITPKEILKNIENELIISSAIDPKIFMRGAAND